MKKTALFLLCFTAGLIIYGQKQAANWYFGDTAGIKFNENGTITEFTDGELTTNEGCTTISDTDGNLLFYTDGITVWDRLHRVMPSANRVSGGLYGDPSSTQSAIVIPKPKDPNVYYIFTVDTSGANNQIDFGFNYSIVDMTLNGGFGDIAPLSKNLNLLVDSSEKISAVVKDCQSQELWVLTFGPSGKFIDEAPLFDTFYAYQVTDTGINTTPVTSTFDDLLITDPRGYLKFSPDGSKIACANVRSGLYLYDFNVNTGEVTNQEEISINLSPQNKPQFPYGLEFSQNNALLYVSTYYDALDPDEFIDKDAQYSALLQYNLAASDISSSEVVIDERITFRGGLQLGIDGRIYKAMSESYIQGLPYLSVINTPNALGLASNYEHNKISLSRNSTQGLPPFITSFFTQKINITGNTNDSQDLEICSGDTYELVAPFYTDATYTWYRNGNILPDSDNNFTVKDDLSGVYRVLIDLNTNKCEDRFEGVARVIFNPKPAALNSNITQCDEDAIKDGLTIFNLNEANASLTNNIDNYSTRFYLNIDRTIEIPNPNEYSNVSNPETIYVQVVNDDTLCISDVELTLSVSITDSFDTQLTVCDDDGVEDGFYVFNLNKADDAVVNELPDGLTVSYYSSYNDALLENGSLDNMYTNTKPYNQIIYARVESENNCYGISEVELIVNELPQVEITDLTYYCLNFFPETITIDAGVIDSSLIDKYQYLWDSGETTYTIDVNEIKTYNVEITDKKTGCPVTRQIKVEPSNIATFNIPNSKKNDPSSNNTVEILVSGEGEYEYALYDENNIEVYRSYQSAPLFNTVKPGIYTVRVKDVKNNCGVEIDKISVIGFPKFFTPNNDGVNDTWQLYGVSKMFEPNSKVLIYNRFGKLIKEITPLSTGWDGSLNGQLLPVDDYWFSVTLEDGRIFRGHFTLKK